ncbi:MAG: HAMP domain-containing histidine kinase [Clostridia bacterium]|nr:HAMP domain-containing histidine kinase [Clostridia bacterium]
METKRNDTDNMKNLQSINTELDVFFDGLPQDVVYAACKGLDAFLHPMAYVSNQLMLLRQTESCKNMMADVGFYSLEGILPEAVCETIRQCIQTGTEQNLPVSLQERRWELHIVPAGQGALLVFASSAQQQVGVTLAAARLRDSAQNLMVQADLLGMKGMPDMAAQLRQQAMRILRQVNHMQLLAGSPEPMHWSECSACELMHDIVRQLEQKKIHVAVREPEKDILFRADRRLLSAAWLTLISNSLRHVGTDAHLLLSAEKVGNSISFGVTDDGEGLSEEALERMNSTWQKQDAVFGSWGLGIPYARRIAAMHSGLLLFVRGNECGTSAYIRIPLHTAEVDAMESGSGYRAFLASGISAADIELSDALEAEAFMKN